MIPDVTNEEMRFLVSADLHEAEQSFEDIKVRMLRRAAGEGSLARARQYLKTIEDLLAEKHAARRARRHAENQPPLV